MDTDALAPTPLTTPPAPSSTEATNALQLNQAVAALSDALNNNSAAAISVLNAIAAAITNDLIGGTTGATANALLVSKGTGGFALQPSAHLFSDPATAAVAMHGTTSGVVTVTPAAIAGTWTFTLPTTAGTNGYALTTDGFGITSWAANGGLGIGAANTALTSNGAVASWTTINYATLDPGVTAAQADMEAATSTSVFVTPGNQLYHPGMPKATGRGAAAGGIVGSAYNVTSIVHNSTGNYTVNLSITLSSTNYWVLVTPINAVNERSVILTATSQTAFTVVITNGTGSDRDESFGFAVYGDI